MPKRINAFPTTATSPADDDFILLDGATNNSRKLLLARLLANQRTALAPRGGVAFDGTAGQRVFLALLGQNLDVDPFSVVVQLRVPSAAATQGIFFIGSSATLNNVARGFLAEFRSTGHLYVTLIGGTTGDTRTAQVANFFTNWAGKVISLTITKSSSGLVIWVNGQIQTQGAEITVGNPPSWSAQVISTNFVLGTNSVGGSEHFTGTIYSASLYNTLLSAADVEEIYELSGAVPERFKFGSQAARYTSNFSTASTDNWSVDGNMTVTSNVDAINGQDDWLRAALTGTRTLYVRNGGSNMQLGKVYRFSGRVFIPAAAPFGSIQIWTNNGPTAGPVVPVVPNTQYDITATLLVSTSLLTGVRMMDGAGAPGSLFPSGSEFYLKNWTTVQVGAVVHLPLNDAAGLQLRDDSTNRLHALMTTAGVTHVLPLFGGAFPVRFVTSTNGNQQALGASCVPLNCQILRVRARTQSGTATVSLGNASGGAQIVSAAALTTSWQVLTIVGGWHITATQNLWVSSNSASVVEWDLELEEVRL